MRRMKDTATVVAIAAVISGIALPFIVVPLALWNGFVVSTVWNWLAVPAFHAPPLTVPAAIAATLLIGMVTRNPLRPEPKDERKFAVIATVFVAYYAFVFAGAYVLKGFL